MRSSEFVTSQHLARKAVSYVRQSTPNQVLTNRESLKLQYALKKRVTGAPSTSHQSSFSSSPTVCGTVTTLAAIDSY